MRGRRRTWWAGGLLLGGLLGGLLVGCGGEPSTGLRVGQTAPEIEGTDVQGRQLKLSDYRGKVVVLDFWATWCPPCVRMVPHEKALVRRMEGKPFAFLGISNDEERGDLADFVKKNEVPWPNWFDGRGGPITLKYEVDGFPTLFVLDGNGTVRYRDLHQAKELDQAVDTLMKELGP